MRFTILSLTSLLLVAVPACNRSPDRGTAGARRSDSVSLGANPATTPRTTLSDANVVAMLEQANAAEIEAGDLAARKAVNPEVRALGKRFASDHRKVEQQARQLASRLNLTPAPPAEDELARDHADAMQDLRGRTGRDFDQAYLDHEVEFHQQVIDRVNRDLLPATQNPELRGLIEKVVPALQAHLLAAQNLQKKSGAATS